MTYLQPMKKRTSTREVWPWSYLVPWMEADMTQRQANPGSKGADPYDNGLYMPLRDFIEEPIVKDLLHNGAALQVRCAFRAIILHLLDLFMHSAFQPLGRLALMGYPSKVSRNQVDARHCMACMQADASLPCMSL